MKTVKFHLALLLASVAALPAAQTQLSISRAVTAFAFPYPVPTNHLRIVSWNLEFFNDRSAKTGGAEPDRTPAQLDVLAQRIRGFDAAVVVLQEMDQIAALNDLRNRMGADWAVFAGHVLGLFPQQNALLYDTRKVDLLSAAFVRTHPVTNFTPLLYPTWTYRCPVTGVFSPKGRSHETFRVIGIHGHYQDPEARKTEGYWLASYVSNLLVNPHETRRVILLGDFNGAPPAAPHNELVSAGNLRALAKRNGDLTTIYPDLKLDHIYVTDAARTRLTDPTAFVVRPEYYGETGPQFEAAHSDHLPVLMDYAVAEPPGAAPPQPIPKQSLGLPPPTTLHAGEPPKPLMDSVPFTGGKEGYAVYRCPTLAVSAQRTVLAFCEGRVNSHKDEDDMDVVLKRSTDGGRTWGPLQVLANDGKNPCSPPSTRCMWSKSSPPRARRRKWDSIWH